MAHVGQVILYQLDSKSMQLIKVVWDSVSFGQELVIPEEWVILAHGCGPRSHSTSLLWQSSVTSLVKDGYGRGPDANEELFLFLFWVSVIVTKVSDTASITSESKVKVDCCWGGQD